MRLVAVVVDAAVPYDREIAKGVAQYAREVGDWRLYVEEEECRRLPDLATWQGQGIIASFDDERVARAVQRSGLPLVAVGGGGGFHDPASGIPYVDTDNVGIAVLAAEHLLDRGLASFAYYGLPPGPAVVWSAARAAAYSQRLADAGYACATLAARHDATQWAALQHELGDWLRALPKPVGVMACDDVRARHVLEACAGVGLRVPHEVAVIGVDDDEFVCELSDPPLSSIAQAARGVGIEAARMLDRLMRRRGAAGGRGHPEVHRHPRGGRSRDRRGDSPDPRRCLSRAHDRGTREGRGAVAVGAREAVPDGGRPLHPR